MAALLTVQQNIASEMQALAEEILVIKNRLAVAVAMYGAEDMASLLDVNLQAIPSFAHITVVELTAAKNALDAINTAIGAYEAGTMLQN